MRRQLSAGKEGRRQRLVRSGFAAALVDVVLHQGDDLLQLVVQLGATRRGVGLQSAHHLKGKAIKIKKLNKKKIDFWRIGAFACGSRPPARTQGVGAGGEKTTAASPPPAL